MCSQFSWGARAGGAGQARAFCGSRTALESRIPCSSAPEPQNARSFAALRLWPQQKQNVLRLWGREPLERAQLLRLWGPEPQSVRSLRLSPPRPPVLARF